MKTLEQPKLLTTTSHGVPLLIPILVGREKVVRRVGWVSVCTLESHAAGYTGLARLMRLAFVATHCPILR